MIGEKDANKCLSCLRGKSSTLVQIQAAIVTRCPSGKYSQAGGACTNCEAGKSSASGAHYCRSCSTGKYSDIEGGLCKNCPAGRFSASGASSCTSCPSGKYSVAGGQCTDCSPGKSSTSGDSKCTDCRAGRYTADHGALYCKICDAGKSSPEGSLHCTDCRHQQLTMTLREVFVNVVRQANTHDGRVRFTVRIVSQDHTHQPVANVDLVPKGNSVILTVQYLVMYVRIVPRGNLHGWVLLILLDNCFSCEVGKSSFAGGECGNCTVGKYNNIMGGLCTECPAGKFNDEIGQLDCTNCTEGKYGDETGLFCHAKIV